jgi:hypothetical protein
MADNYRTQVEMARKLFLQSETTELIRKHGLQFDERNIHLRFMDTLLNIDRATGKIVNIPDDDIHTPMGVYDYLCYSREGRKLSGEWTTTASLGLMFHSNASESDTPSQTALYLDEHADELTLVCEKLGGIRKKPGDVSYVLTLFEELPV